MNYDLEKQVNETIKLLKEEYEKIEEMSRNKLYIIRDLENKDDNVIVHLIKLYLWPNSTSKNHWKEEVQAGIRTLDKLKSTNKYPTYKQIYNWYLENRIDRFSYCTKRDIEDALFSEKIPYEKCPQYNIDEVNNYLKDYFVWLFQNLCQKGEVSKLEVYNKIDELLKIYK